METAVILMITNRISRFRTRKHEARSFPYESELARAVRKSEGFVFLVRTK